MQSIDQTGHHILLPSIPHRIVSLVPSQTEFLYAIGAGRQLAGVTKFCVHPKQARTENVIVGGTKNYHPDRVRELQPDLIIANKEENVRESILGLSEDFPVWTSDIFTLSDALQMMSEIARLTGHERRGAGITEEIRKNFEQPGERVKRSALYFIWNNPFMVAGAGTFIHEMLSHAGFVNAASHLTRYPTLSVQEITELNPDFILLSTEPFPFGERHVRELEEYCPYSRVLLVDGEYFSWYGSRLIAAPEYFRKLTSELV